MFEDEDNNFELIALKAFGVGLVIDLVIGSLIILTGFDLWGMLFFGFIIAAHLAISVWILVFRWGCMDDDDYFFLRFGIMAVLLRLL